MRLGGLYPVYKPQEGLTRAALQSREAPSNLRFILPSSIDDFDNIVQKMDHYDLSAIGAPARMQDWEPDDCAAFGERARELGILVGEANFTGNLMSADAETVEREIADARRALRNADLMQCRTLHILVGTKDSSDHMLAAHPYMYTDECRAELREALLGVMDGLDLQHTYFLIEPFNNTFFYQPEDIREFLDSVGHPRVGFQSDPVNMIAFDTYFDTTSLINRTFDLLSDYIFSAHVKDLRWDYRHLILKWDEVLIGDGVFDLATYLKRMDELDPDTPCYCEHLADEESYAHNFARVHEAAEEAGVNLVTRQGGGE
ncbi:MAG: sugar phosphate isomerase/epimerase family protein [Chloroflexota bacterium]|nr:sugar phosphate isomerase/epimerase family protein [Chloroflexota bacterium]